MIRHPPRPPLFPSPPLSRSLHPQVHRQQLLDRRPPPVAVAEAEVAPHHQEAGPLLDLPGDQLRGPRVDGPQDRKSTRLNSSHLVISYAVFCLKKKTTHSISATPCVTIGPHRMRLRRGAAWRAAVATRVCVAVSARVAISRGS